MKNCSLIAIITAGWSSQIYDRYLFHVAILLIHFSRCITWVLQGYSLLPFSATFHLNAQCSMFLQEPLFLSSFFDLIGCHTLHCNLEYRDLDKPRLVKLLPDCVFDGRESSEGWMSSPLNIRIGDSPIRWYRVITATAPPSAPPSPFYISPVHWPLWSQLWTEVHAQISGETSPGVDQGG